jgi:hypothetical protein
VIVYLSSHCSICKITGLQIEHNFLLFEQDRIFGHCCRQLKKYIFQDGQLSVCGLKVKMIVRKNVLKVNTKFCCIISACTYLSQKRNRLFSHIISSSIWLNSKRDISLTRGIIGSGMILFIYLLYEQLFALV